MADIPEEVERKIQDLMAQMATVMSVLNDLALENHIERIPYGEGYIHFGTEFTARNAYDRQERIAGYHAAAGGPVINEKYWSASSFDCWPDEQQKKWMFGDGPARPSHYDQD